MKNNKIIPFPSDNNSNSEDHRVEMLDYRDFHQLSIVESKYAKGHFAHLNDTGKMKCPACGLSQIGLSHGEKRVCDCGLIMQLWGNGLHIWR